MAAPGRPLTWLDVFAAEPLAGNPLAVVHDADGLGDAAMLAFARETGLSETTFVQTATAPGADYRNRIFTTAGELPFAGHPSLGTAVAVAHRHGLAEARFVQQTPAGRQPVTVELTGLSARASMEQEPAVFGPQPGVAEVMAAAGLEPSDAHPTLAPQVVSTGVAHVIAPVRDRDVLAAVAPPAGALRALLEPVGAIVLYLAALGPAPETTARGFFLTPRGVTEDPATGSAAGPLLAYLRERTGADELIVSQGTELLRPSVLRCAWSGDRVRVSGEVAVVADGVVYL